MALGSKSPIIRPFENSSSRNCLRSLDKELQISRNNVLETISLLDQDVLVTCGSEMFASTTES